MTRLLATALLFTVVAIAPADDKKLSDPITAIANDKDDKIETEGGSPTKPVAIRDEESLKKAIPDEATRKRIAKLVDFKEQKLIIFAWQGSGQDKLDYTILESYPEQIPFTFTPGKTDDLRRHVHLFVVRENVSWSVK